MSLAGWEEQIRQARGKSLALLLSKGFDLMSAEDAVGSAVLSALDHWPRFPPANPDSWLMAVAWRKALDQTRRTKRTVSIDEIQELSEPADDLMLGLDSHIPDERLRLYFLCTHPALDPSVQCPLMLQLVVGMTVAQIAELYLVPTPAMAQRLVRVKRKIRDAAIAPRMPDASELPERVLPVLQAIYGLYFSEWRDGAEPHQALQLAMVLADLIPDHAETLGLVALIAFCESRRSARSGSMGEYVPLEEQDVAAWDAKRIERAEGFLRRAASLRSPGRFQLEAAVQSAHVQRRLTGSPPWETIVQLYDRLIALAPTAGFLVGRIAVVARSRGPETALKELDELRERFPDISSSFLPFLATQAHGLADLGRISEAREVARRALALTSSKAERAYFSSRFGLDDSGGTDGAG
jgi:RNA polymerase sigma-70 factor, ECF subfamily